MPSSVVLPPSLGILLNYPETAKPEQRTITLTTPSSLSPSPLPQPVSSKPVIAVFGAGNYAGRQLIPALAKAGAQLHTLVAPSGVNPSMWAGAFDSNKPAQDIEATLADPTINTVVIATRHDSHASLVQKALASGKHVFVEKPLCLNRAELQAIQSVYASHQATASASPLLMVGFNRRFAPLLIDLKQELSRLQGPKAFVYTCNAGAIPADHWTQDPVTGGGRLLGRLAILWTCSATLLQAPSKICSWLPLPTQTKPRYIFLTAAFCGWLYRHCALFR